MRQGGGAGEGRARALPAPVVLLVGAVAILAPVSLGAQCVVAPVPLEERVAMSPAIVIGRVVGQHPFVAPRTGVISTANRIEVEAWLKGDEVGRELVVVTPGGVLGEQATMVVPALELETGGEYLFFLDIETTDDEDPQLRRLEPGLRQSLAYADTQGAIRRDDGVYRDALVLPPLSERELFGRVASLTGRPARAPDGSPFTPRAAPDREPVSTLAITGLSPNPTNAGTIVPSEFLVISGSGFGSAVGTVSFANADDGGATTTTPPVTSDYVSWSDTSITVKVPKKAGTGTVTVNGTLASPSPLAIGYSHIEINNTGSGWPVSTRQRYYFRSLNGAGGFTFQFNSTSGFSGNAPAVASFERALATWRCATGVNFTRTRTTTATGFGDDTTNVVMFDASLPSGVLGRATYYMSFGSTGSCNQANTVWWLRQVDLQFKPDPPIAGYPWQYGPAPATSAQFDFESVALHELGHGHGLGHRKAAGELMNYSISNGHNRRSPAPLEVTGGAARVAYSVVPTCFNPSGSGTPMVAVAAAGCTFVDDPLDADDDDDGAADGSDCAPGDGSTWGAPAQAVTTLTLSKSGGSVSLAWNPPASPGSTTPRYDLVRSSSPSTFAAGSCVASDQSGLTATDAGAPPDAFFLVRVENPCGGLVAPGTGGATVPVRSCP